MQTERDVLAVVSPSFEMSLEVAVVVGRKRKKGSRDTSYFLDAYGHDTRDYEGLLACSAGDQNFLNGGEPAAPLAVVTPPAPDDPAPKKSNRKSKKSPTGNAFPTGVVTHFSDADLAEAITASLSSSSSSPSASSSSSSSSSSSTSLRETSAKAGARKLCEHTDGCDKQARKGGLCKAHGGGKRCEFGGCTKSAQGDTPFCKAHGGGKRCEFGSCTKSAVGDTPFCVRHGGGKRCEFGSCTKSAQGDTPFCVRHGGGSRKT